MCARSNPARKTVEVILDADFLAERAKVGVLHYTANGGQGIYSFEYDPAWLKRRDAFEIDPELQLFAGDVYPTSEHGRFRIFLDSAPDRWGRVLLEKRESLAARLENRAARKLTDWDFLLGVHDSCRMGALRFRVDGRSPFLDHDRARAAPPLASLRELEAASLALESADAADQPEYGQWLLALLAPGTSLGGARPKANFSDTDNRLWIAKFPSRQDRRDVGAWEFVTHQLGRNAGIDFPEAKLLTLGGNHRTYATCRFDRTPADRRRFFVSALTLLQKDDGAEGSYLEMAEFLSTRGSPKHKRDDLRQLWTRIVFNIAVGNRDDHLRNHGFILGPDGWRLAPAYDVNPNPDKAEHAIAIDEGNPTPDLSLAMETCAYYQLDTATASEIRAQVLRAVSEWRSVAQRNGISRSEVELMERVFTTEVR